jgi:hypothetical protein
MPNRTTWVLPAQGAVRVGVTASTVVPGRELPRTRVPLEGTGSVGRRMPR